LCAQWISLKQRAQAVFVVEALKARDITLWEAFTAFDSDSNGVLSPSEFYGALKWLEVRTPFPPCIVKWGHIGFPSQVPALTADDVADFIEAIDTNRDGLVSLIVTLFNN
jgi:Ca2+-binding EF-hand superfamily protein